MSDPIDPTDQSDSPETLDAIQDDRPDMVMQDPLPQDNGTPTDLPVDPISDMTDDEDRREASGQLDDTHQATDGDLDSTELLDEGLSGAAEAEEPNAGNAVVDFHPEDTQNQP
ncbi:MAG: hypothetical protein JWN38_896 [Candidatus Saccharibacteria bacterium]|nr:hypothetical protein [Candidatus Saccharibacteria bacterium]